MRKTCLYKPLALCFVLLFSLLESAPKAPFDFTHAAKEGSPAVVSIRTAHESTQSPLFSPFQSSTGRLQSLGQGSGFFTSSDGYIITNFHVIGEATAIQVTLNDNRSFAAELVGTDPNTDLAVLKIRAKKLPYLDFADSDSLEVGQWVAAIGNPLGLQASLSVGVLSARGRSNLDLVRFEDFLQTDAAIN